MQKIYLSLAVVLFCGLAIFSIIGQSHTPQAVIAAANDLDIYTDSLAPGWVDWSWNVTHAFDNPAPVHAGSASIAVTVTTGWGGLYLLNDTAISASSYTALHFWIHGGSTGGQTVLVSFNTTPTYSVTPQANTWLEVTIPFSELGSPAAIGDLVWQGSGNDPQPVFYLDEIALVGGGTPTPTPEPGEGPALSVDAAANVHPISPYIYGMNFADQALAAELHLPANRWGGNSTTRYNWQNDTTNTGSDWYFENVPDEIGAADLFMAQNQLTGAQSLITVPLIGWVAKSRPEGHPFDCGFSIEKYGEQQDRDWQWDPDCGNGNYPNGTPITGNDPHETSIEITPDFVTGWIAHMIETFDAGSDGSVRFYNLDNEPMLWPYTHRDVHPAMTTYDEMRDRTWAYASALKAADPQGLTLGPVVWGWCAYFYSAADGCTPGDDYHAHGDTPFVPWYLQQMQAYETTHGVRILDYVDVHSYPEADGVSLAPAGDAATQALRLRSTRSLWDPTYTDESWIGQPVTLIPRMKQWVTENYPGTKLAITEYNWGALDHINGALAQADVLGIFGREGLDLATLWGPPETDQPGAYAFRMYRNYDGQCHTFGQTSVQAASADQSRVAVYAARRYNDGALTLMVINKTTEPLTSTVSLANFDPAGTAQVFQYSAANLAAIVQQPDQPVSAAGFTTLFPAESITLIVIPPAIPHQNLYLPIAYTE